MSAMHIVVLMAMIVTLTALQAPSLGVSPLCVPVAGGLYLAVTAALSRLAVIVGLRAVRGGAGRAVRISSLLSQLTQGWMIAGAGGLVVLGYGAWVMEDLHLAQVPLVGWLVVLTPFVASVVLSWTLVYPLYRATRLRVNQDAVTVGRLPLPIWTLRQYLANNLRHQLLFIVVPVALIVLGQDVLMLYVGPLMQPETADYVIPAAMLAVACGVFLVVPLLIVRIWRTRRLSDGPLRGELAEVSGRLNLRFRELLIWRSGGVIANAAVIGVISRARYVLLSDALIDNMSPAQIRAVFAHEAGHIMHHHMPYMAMFALSSAVLCTSAATGAADVFGLDDLSAGVIAGVLLVSCWAVGFGWISRRFERQSDVTAAWAADPETFTGDSDYITPEGAGVYAGALEQIARLNGMSPRRSNWRHGPIAWRVSYVLWLGARYGSRRRIDRTVKRIKLVLWAAMAVAGAISIWQLAVDLRIIGV